MKKLLVLPLLLIALSACIRPWQVDPETGEIPLVSAAQDAVGPALSGNWLGAALTLVLGTVAGCFGMKRKKDDQIEQIVKAIEQFKSKGAVAGEESPVVSVLLSELSKSMNTDTKALVAKLRESLAKG